MLNMQNPILSNWSCSHLYTQYACTNFFILFLCIQVFWAPETSVGVPVNAQYLKMLFLPVSLELLTSSYQGQETSTKRLMHVQKCI